MEAVLTIAPPLPCASICVISCFRHRNTPIRFTDTILATDDGASSWMRWPAGPTARPEIPALLKAQSMRPNAETVRATILATSVSSVTSPSTAIDWPPMPLIMATVPSRPSFERSDTATRAPSRAIATAVARPMPDAPPVTNATLPSRMPAMKDSLCASAFSFDRDLDEIGLIGRDRVGNGGRDVGCLLDPDCLDAHAGSQLHEIEPRPGQIHVLIGMLRPGFEVLAPDIHIVLENAVFAVRQHDEHNRELVVRGGPERLDGVHRRTVARDSDDRVIRHRDLHTDCAGQTLADAAAAPAEVVAEAAKVEGAREIETCRDAFIDDHDVVGKAAPKLRGHPRHRSGLAAPGFFAPGTISLRFPGAQLGKRLVARLRGKPELRARPRAHRIRHRVQARRESTDQACVKPMIEREPLRRFLDLDDHGTVRKMPARRVPNVFEERPAEEQNEIGVAQRLPHLPRIAGQRVAAVRMAGREGRV